MEVLSRQRITKTLIRLRMCRLIFIFVVRIWQQTGFLMMWLICFFIYKKKKKSYILIITNYPSYLFTCPDTARAMEKWQPQATFLIIVPCRLSITFGLYCLVVSPWPSLPAATNVFCHFLCKKHFPSPILNRNVMSKQPSHSDDTKYIYRFNTVKFLKFLTPEKIAVIIIVIIS